MSQFTPLMPWQRIPDWCSCAQCRQPADGFGDAGGMLVFYCNEHCDAITDLVLFRLELGGFDGYRSIRYTWKYWAGSKLYRITRTPKQRRTTRERAEKERAIIKQLGLYDAPSLGLLDLAEKYQWSAVKP